VCAVAAGTAGLLVLTPVPASAGSGNPLSLKSLAFANSYIDVTAGRGVVALEWTVGNTDAAASDVYGTVRLRMADPAGPGYLGQTYDLDFRFEDRNRSRAEYVSGSLTESTYRYHFPVPRYGATETSRWTVTSVTLHNNAGATRTIKGKGLRPHRGDLTARTLVDSTPPSLNRFDQTGSDARPYVYVGDGDRFVHYDAYPVDWESGVRGGTLRLSGPGGRVISSDFEVVQYDDYAVRCGRTHGGDLNAPSCGLSLTVPDGTASGVWEVTGMELVDNVGNRTIATDLNAEPLIVTSNEVLSAGGFAATPNPVDNWIRDADTRVGMTVSGAQGGVSAIHLDFDTSGCWQRDTTPTVEADGTLSVPVRVYWRTARCVLTGLAVVDGAGNLALYGTRYGAPDPALTISRLPNTTPPTVTGVSVTPSTVARSRAGDVRPVVTAAVTAPVAPVNGYTLYLYDTDGSIVAQQFGGAALDAQGNLRIVGYLPYDIAPGVYTYGLIVNDASGLRSEYGTPGGSPMPGGPLQITVTDD
jgi:hypothetical protein